MNDDTRFELTLSDAALAALYLAHALGTGARAQLQNYVATLCAFDTAAARDRLDFVATLMAEMVDAADGFDSALDLIEQAVSRPYAATVYALTADYIAAYGTADPEHMRYLERLGASLHLNRLTRAALDMAAQARTLRLDEDSK